MQRCGRLLLEAFLLQVSGENLLGLLAEALVRKVGNAATMSLVRSFQVFADPALHVCNLGEVITGPALAGVERGETNAESDVIDVGFCNDLVAHSGRNLRGILEEVQQVVAGEAPALLVPLSKCGRVAQRLGE